MADVAFAAGFASIRQFNETVQSVFAASPTSLRKRVLDPDRPVAPGSTTLVLRLPFRQPLCPDNLFGHLAATAVPGVEEVKGQTYRRTLRLAHGPGIVELTPGPESISCRAILTDLRDLTTTIARCRWLLDLDADPTAIDQLLASDPHPGPDGGQGPRSAGSPVRRRERAGRAGRPRTAGVDPGGPDPCRPPWSRPTGRR